MIFALKYFIKYCILLKQNLTSNVRILMIGTSKFLLLNQKGNDDSCKLIRYFWIERTNWILREM